MQKETYHIFIGYDEREHSVFDVAEHSILKTATVPVKIHKLAHRPLRDKGLFKREWLIDAKGQYVDCIDSRPFSTQFSHTRFLTPFLWNLIEDSSKSPLVTFMDCDFLAIRDIAEMFDGIQQKRIRNSYRHPVYCVQHDFKPTKDIKMDGMKQTPYTYKCWSALMVFDMNNDEVSKLTPLLVNTADGKSLHQFEWVNNPHMIGTIPEEWQFIPFHSEKNTDKISMIHYSELGPWFPGGEDLKYADLWLKEYKETMRDKYVE